MSKVIVLDNKNADEIVDLMGAKVKNLSTLGERSATGMDYTCGVLVVEIVAGSVASRFLQANFPKSERAKDVDLFWRKEITFYC